MKRSRTVHLVLLASAAVTLDSCSKQECVDENNVVVDYRYCQGLLPPQGGHGYRFYNGGFFFNTPIGSSVSRTGTIRGIFGTAGESAHGGGGAGE